MKRENFERLKESIIEAGRIKRGEILPSREFTYEVDSSEIKPANETWAVCIETDDDELLIPGKIYLVQQLTGGFWVRDEDDEATLCPQEFFMPIKIPQRITKRLENLKQAA